MGHTHLIICNGITQGAVLSHSLFRIYLDDCIYCMPYFVLLLYTYYYIIVFRLYNVALMYICMIYISD